MADMVNRIYSGFRGVDFRGEEINLVRSPDALNMWKDYQEIESVRTRPGLALSTTFSSQIYGIFFYKTFMLVHSGTVLYKVAGGTKTSIYTGLNEIKSNAFVYDGLWYFKDGKHYLKYDGTTIEPVEGYIPTTSIARKPMGGGTTYEDVNMLSDYRINSFLADGMSFSFFLDTINIDNDYFPKVICNGEEIINGVNGVIEVDYALGQVVINLYRLDPETGEPEIDSTTGEIMLLAPDAPLTEGQDNITIQFKKAIPQYRECILKCSLLQVFDNRVFFSGNPDYPNYVWHTSVNDPSYCSDLDYYKEGMDTAAITGLVAGNNALWVFREPSDSNTTVFYHTPALDDEYGKVYPSSHSSISTGCIGGAVNFNDDIVFFSERGMEGISGDVTTEQVVAHRSTLVDRKMTAEEGYKDMVLAEWKGYFVVFIGNKAYLADSRTMFQNENHYEYEWFYWEMDKTITCACVQDGILYVGTNEGIYTLTDTGKDIPCHWVTPKDKIKYPNKLKTTNKRGCVAEATGDVTVSAKLEDTEFEVIGTYQNVTDYFVSRIKRKKFKDIQLKFSSDTRFSLESVTLECFIGGYVKR